MSRTKEPYRTGGIKRSDKAADPPAVSANSNTPEELAKAERFIRNRAKALSIDPTDILMALGLQHDPERKKRPS